MESSLAHCDTSKCKYMLTQPRDTATQRVEVSVSSIDDLERVLTMAEAVMLKVTSDDLAKPTPCSEWDVRALANHMTGVCIMFGRAAQGEAIEGRPTFTDLIGDDPGAAYIRAAGGEQGRLEFAGRRLRGRCTIPAGQLPGNVAIAINTADQLLHTCDLAARHRPRRHLARRSGRNR